MILESIVFVLSGLIMAILNPLPDVPVMPQEIIDVLTLANGLIGDSMNVLRFVYGSTFLNIIIATLIGLSAFELIYWVTLWAAKKIPFINIK